ncbi:MAG: 50S ribosomal protein L25 [Dehalococcoidia bacterium]|nr:50S ribosomal protein L25 [Dehalococcoidia bacterium]MDH4299663.1 50S ribosomal protein L25 [Dehalococcoidia bacterium]MDH4368039.1 50S ribosomal protein L25 [Dehalococcoidia bacterium]
MDKIELKVANRKILGKKVKHLRRQGITPVHVFGHGIESLALQCDARELERVLSQAGQTRLINLKLAKEKKPRTVVVREFDRDWRKGELVHVDFYQVKMEEKIRVEVPVVLLGEAPALKSKTNMLDHELGTFTVECLPARIPSSIEVDISSLAELDQAIRVKDITLDKDITVINNPDLVVAKISLRPVEKVEEKVVEEVVAAEAEAEAEVAEAEAEAPKEAAPDQKKSKET